MTRDRFSELVRQYERLVYTVCFQLVRDGPAAEDLTQEIFLASDGDWSLCTEMIFKVRAGQKYSAADLDLEGDWSSAVPFLVAGAVFGRACVDGLNTASVQADLAIMDVLMAAGASITQLDSDEVEIPVLAEPMIAESTLGRRKTA